MSTSLHQLPEENKNQPASGEQDKGQEKEGVQISLPQIDRPEGPFEHSGETANWTKEEKEEQEQTEQQQ